MKKRLVFLLFGLIAAIIAFSLYSYDLRENPTPLKSLDLRMKDARFRLRGPVKPDRHVVIVAIDHKSIKEIGRWPWSREVTGRLIENLGVYYGTKVTALDIVFSEPQHPEADRALAESIRKSGNVVMGYFFRDEQHEPAAESIAQLENARLKMLKVDEDAQDIPIPVYANVDLNVAQIGKNALDFGFFNVQPDADGLYRNSILMLTYNNDIYTSLAMKALQHYLGSETMLDIQEWGVDNMQIGSLTIPSREDGSMALNYYGPAGSFMTVAAADIIKKRLPKGELKGKIAFVGATEAGIYDLRPTPFDKTLPGIEIHATMAANALDKSFLKYDGVTREMEIASIFLIPLVLSLLLAFAPRTFAGLGIMAAVTAVFLFFNYKLFASLFRDVTVVYPLIGIAVAYLGSEAWRNLVVERKGRSLRKAFSSYVSPDLVRQIEKNPDKLILGGEQRELSVLFSDIRGFTTVAESLTPPELVTLLNEYLSPMTRIVLEEKGTLDKFVGDAIMALFNAPLDVAAHATHACNAAVRMLERLKELNEEFKLRGMQTLDIGVGINTGLAVVGNMGADIRFDYTAIGDAVNLASRLEGLNKYYGTHILVSDDTRNQVSDQRFIFREVDRVCVKGKHTPVVMYELMIAKSEILPRFEEALAMYRAKEFVAAKTIFEELSEVEDDGPSRLYVERCSEYIEHPPPSDWAGVHTAKSK